MTNVKRVAVDYEEKGMRLILFYAKRIFKVDLLLQWQLWHKEMESTSIERYAKQVKYLTTV